LKLVVDSSVSLKWWLDDEDFIGEARALLSRITGGSIELVLPELWLYEVANGVTTAARRNRISVEDGALFIEELQAIPFKLYPIASHLNMIYNNAARYKYAVYDMVYVTIAET
jgi:predicted nucleic acid-binding protein